MDRYSDRKNARSAAVLALSGVANLPTLACGYDSLISDSLSVPHPLSKTVTFALRDAEAENLVDGRRIPSKAGDLAALFSATEHLQALRTALQSARTSNPDVFLPSFSLLLIESGIWSRYSLDDRVRLAVHTDGAPAGDPIVVTGDLVLAAIIDGRLTIAEAFRRGLAALEGPRELRNFLAALKIPSSSP